MAGRVGLVTGDDTFVGGVLHVRDDFFCIKVPTMSCKAGLELELLQLQK
jgi:hypothetical protein